MKKFDDFNWDFNDEEEFEVLSNGEYYWEINNHYFHLSYKGTDKIITQIVNFYNKYKYKCNYFRADINNDTITMGHASNNLYKDWKNYKFMGFFEDWINNKI